MSVVDLMYIECFPVIELFNASFPANAIIQTSGSPESRGEMNQSAKERVVGAATATASQEGISEIELHQYYAVYFSKMYYIGRVTAALDEEYEVKFLHKLYKNAVAYFFLPKKPDIDKIKKERFFYGPIGLTGTPDDFTIEEGVLSKITLRYNEMKQKLH
ncbi:uncharacterized protein LOC135496242 [Lineus longissimus]|uniref:uncharacterized protein LOC135496242 n=1 Tax=Lineus longissimus TaxID=88925 RepID=UPI00315CEA81